MTPTKPSKRSEKLRNLRLLTLCGCPQWQAVEVPPAPPPPFFFLRKPHFFIQIGLKSHCPKVTKAGKNGVPNRKMCTRESLTYRAVP